MRKIVIEAERFLSSSNTTNSSPAILAYNGKALLGGMLYEGPDMGTGSGVVEKSRNVDAKCIVVTGPSDMSGHAPSLSAMSMSVNISRFRPNVPIIAFVSSAKEAKLLQIHRGIYPVLLPLGKSTSMCIACM